ncbi:MAG: hypothetical protein DRP70_16060 [Spirochaetes bacterium]|nr:MAG: hypothetical protein DRP49_08720 [Spirochaetota bacterium]RKX82637.1 MAG: hypothetical protein DRP70_16060 [Spirochaetota bacterium]RKX97202.1 MAG: hypothetical protein DRZ90_07025 [Spirochaetota bacterium]
MNKTGVSLVSLHTANEIEDFSEDYFRKKGIYPNFELSYQMNPQDIEDASFIKGRVLSGHAPCPGIKYFPNLGSRNTAVLRESINSIKQSADTIAAFGGNILVLHAGYTIDGPVFKDFEQRKKTLEIYERQSTQLWKKTGSICKPDYWKSDEYRIHMDQTLKNLKKAAVICMDKGVLLAVENLNPRLTYLFQVPEDFSRMMEEIKNISICIDIGHLWISSLVHNFNYFKALKLLTQTGGVVTAHIHDNTSNNGKVPHYNDDHGTIGTGRVPIQESIQHLIKYSSANLIIEATSNPYENLALLESML